MSLKEALTETKATWLISALLCTGTKNVTSSNKSLCVSFSVKINGRERKRSWGGDISPSKSLANVCVHHYAMVENTAAGWRPLPIYKDAAEQDQENTITSCGEPVHSVYFCRTLGALHPLLCLSDLLKLLLLLHFFFPFMFSISASQSCFL